MKRKINYFLDHHEKPAKINAETGEFSEVRERKNNIPAGKELFRNTHVTRAFFDENYKTIP